MTSKLYRQLKEIVKREIPDLILDLQDICDYAGRIRKLRIVLIDNTFIDIWFSSDGSYAFHWEQRPIQDKIYRHDNAPHKKWSFLSTYPQHCHDGNQNHVVASYLSTDIQEGFREFLLIIRTKFKEI